MDQAKWIVVFAVRVGAIGVDPSWSMGTSRSQFFLVCSKAWVLALDNFRKHGSQEVAIASHLRRQGEIPIRLRFFALLSSFPCQPLSSLPSPSIQDLDYHFDKHCPPKHPSHVHSQPNILCS